MLPFNKEVVYFKLLFHAYILVCIYQKVFAKWSLLITVGHKIMQYRQNISHTLLASLQKLLRRGGLFY